MKKNSIVLMVRLEFQSRSSTQNQCARYSIATKASAGFVSLHCTRRSGKDCAGDSGMGTVRRCSMSAFGTSTYVDKAIIICRIDRLPTAISFEAPGSGEYTSVN